MDITERRRAEQELFEAHTELRAIHAAAPVTLLVVDEQFRVQRVSDLVSPGADGDRENTALRPGEAIACFHALSDSLGCGYGSSCETCAVRAAIRECIEGGAAVPAAEAWLPVVSGPGEQESRCVLISATPMRFGETRRALLCVQDMTTLRNTERQLEQQRASLLRQAELINLSHDAIITTDENRAIVTWNGGATEMYGWAEQEALGRPLHELLRTEYDRPRAEIDAVLKSDGRWQGELLHTRKDGQQIAVESRQVLVCDDGRTSTTLLEINRDITARKQAEQALAQNLERLERVLEVETVGVMFRDLNTGCIVDANDAFLKLTGYTRAEVEQRKLMWQNLTPPEYMDVSRAEIEKSMATGRVGPYEKEYFRQDGTRKWLLSAGSSLANNQCVEFCVDISDRKRAEQALRESEQRVRRKLESVLSPEEDIGEPLELEDIIDIEALQAMMDDLYALAHLPTAILDTKGKVLVRSGWQEICTEFHRVHPDTLQHCIESDTALSTTAGPGDFKLYKCKNNLCDVATPFYVSGRKLGNIFTGQFLLDDEPVDMDLFASQAALHGFDQQQYLAALARVPRVSRRAAEQGIAFLQRFGAFIGKLSHANIKLARSLAQLQRSEDTIRRLNADLEERVQQRTAQLEASNKELEAFAYSVSHDLRAPLRGIDGWSLALLEDYGGLLNEEAREYLSRVRSETQRMGQLIDDLLQLSRLTRTEMKSEAVDLTSVARNVAERLRENNPGRDVEFAIQPGLDAVGDASLLEVAIGNLLGNAVKFTGTRAKARVEFGQTESAGSRTFYVRDNGVGFDMAYADMLFGAFQRLHKASEFPGTGIGLATVQRVIRRHGGRVWAESRPNEGATFYFIIASGSATAVNAR